MTKYEKKLRQMKVFYEEYAGLVSVNRDIALTLNQMLQTAGKPLAHRLIDGLAAHVKRDVKYINKYSNGYKPQEPQSENNAVETVTAGEERQSSSPNSPLVVSESGLSTDTTNPPQ